MFKKLKKLFIFIIILPLAFAFAGCKKKNNGGSNSQKPPSQEQPTGPENPTTPEDPENPEDPETPEDPGTPETQNFSVLFDFNLPQGYESICENVSFTGEVGKGVLIPAVPDSNLAKFHLGWFDSEGQKLPADKLSVDGSVNQELKFTADWNVTGIKNYYYTQGLSFTKGTDNLENEVAVVTNYIGGSKNVIIPKFFVLADEEYPVRIIGDGAFENKGITSILFNADGMIIEDDAFKKSQLETVDLSKVIKIGNYAFAETKLKTVVISALVSEIKNGSFDSCKSLESVDFSSNAIISSVSQSMFSDCESLKTVKLSNKITKIEVSAFSGCEKLVDFSFMSDKVEEIESNAFEDCGFVEVTIPETVKKLGIDIFQDCDDLKTIKTYKLYNIGDLDRFVYTYGDLNETVAGIELLGENIISIPEYYFQGLSALKRIVLADSITTIGEYAFDKCVNLLSIDFPQSLNFETFTINSIEETAFYKGITTGLDINNVRILAPKSVSGVVEIPNNIVAILDGAYSENTAITSVKIPASVKSIGTSVFFSCSSLESVIFEDDSELVSIGDYAFYGCEKLGSINLEKCVKLKSIGDMAFSEIDANISKITLQSAFENLGYGVFYNSNIAEFEVAAANTNFVSVDGVIYNKNKTVLYVYPQLKNDQMFEIFETVTFIQELAFANNKNLKCVYVSSESIVFGDDFGFSNVFDGSGYDGNPTFVLSEKTSVYFSSSVNDIFYLLSNDYYDVEFVDDDWVVTLKDVDESFNNRVWFIEVSDGEKDYLLSFSINVSGETFEVTNQVII